MEIIHMLDDEVVVEREDQILISKLYLIKNKGPSFI